MKLVKINHKKLTKGQLEYVEGKIKFDGEGKLTKESNKFIEDYIYEMTHKYYDYDGHLHEEDNLITEQIAALIYKKSVEMTKILGTYKKHDPRPNNAISMCDARSMKFVRLDDYYKRKQMICIDEVIEGKPDPVEQQEYIDHKKKQRYLESLINRFTVNYNTLNNEQKGKKLIKTIKLMNEMKLDIEFREFLSDFIVNEVIDITKSKTTLRIVHGVLYENKTLTSSNEQQLRRTLIKK